MTIEIEKKFLLKHIPQTLQWASSKTIHQTYLATGDEELRIRKTVKDEKEFYTMTIKRGTGLVREEIENDISSSTYEQLLSSTGRKPLIKTRKVTIISSHSMEYEVEVDFYEELNLIVAEIEFTTEAAANLFIKPDWFDEDVTDDKSYKNQNLWKDVQV
jgi:CYTH domain-containing protein